MTPTFGCNSNVNNYTYEIIAKEEQDAASLARHDKGLATIVRRANKDASRHVLDAVMRTTMERLRTWDFRNAYSDYK